MITMSAHMLRAIEAAAESAYPEECCGLLAGHRQPSDDLVITRVQPSPNVAGGDRRRRFEVDPQVRFDLMRAVEKGPDGIVGLYHSHPDHPAEPSAHDLSMVYEPDLVWLITAVEKGRAVGTTAHALSEDGSRFVEVKLKQTHLQGENP